MKNKVYRLDELCDIKSGKRIPKEMDFVTFETEHPYIRARDIKAGKINTDDLIYLEDDVFQKIKRYIINSGDIAITIVAHEPLCRHGGSRLWLDWCCVRRCFSK